MQPRLGVISQKRYYGGTSLMERKKQIHALEIARRQQAKALVLRASLSLARLYVRQSERAKARQTLAEIYGWFTEGTDAPDMKEAGALLADL